MVAPVPAQISKFHPRPPAAAHRSLPLLPALHSLPPLFSSPLPAVAGVVCIMWRQYLSRSQQLPHTSCRHGVYPFTIPDVQTFGPSNTSTLLFTGACRLFAFFCELPSFVFNRLEPLFQKHPGGGGYLVCLFVSLKPLQACGTIQRLAECPAHGCASAQRATPHYPQPTCSTHRLHCRNKFGDVDANHRAPPHVALYF